MEKKSFTDSLFWRLIAVPVCFCLIFLLVKVLANILTAIYALAFFNFHDFESVNGISSTIAPIFDSLLNILILYFYMAYRRRRRNITVGMNRLSGRGYVLPIVLAFGSLAISSLFLLILQNLGALFPLINDKLRQYQQLISNAISGNENYILTTISIAICVPVAEELLFRGLIMEEWLNRTKPAVAICVQALIFSLMHMNFVQSGYVFVVGILLGLVYYYTRSITASILLHMIFNFLGGVLSSMTLQGREEADLTTLGGKIQIGIAIFSFICLLVGIFLLFRYRKRKELLIKSA